MFIRFAEFAFDGEAGFNRLRRLCESGKTAYFRD